MKFSLPPITHRIAGSDILAAHPPFLTPAIQLIRDLLRNADRNVSLVGTEAQQGESACQRACKVHSGHASVCIVRLVPTECRSKGRGDGPFNISSQPECSLD